MVTRAAPPAWPCLPANSDTAKPNSAIIEAQFSTHFSLAMTAVLDANNFSAYHAMEKQNFEHPGVSDLARRVEVVFDPELEARFPDISKSTVAITTKSGQTIRGDGFGYRKLPQEEVERKFYDLVSGILTPDQARGVIDAVANMEKIKNITELTQLLVRGKKGGTAAGKGRKQATLSKQG